MRLSIERIDATESQIQTELTDLLRGYCQVEIQSTGTKKNFADIATTYALATLHLLPDVAIGVLSNAIYSYIKSKQTASLKVNGKDLKEMTLAEIEAYMAEQAGKQ